MRVLFVDETPARTSPLRERLRAEGCSLIDGAAGAGDPLAQLGARAAVAPDCVVVHVTAPSSGLLERLRRVMEESPRAIAVFADDASIDAIREATRAGASACVVDATSARRLRPIVEAAAARFAELHALRRELASARTSLAQRKRIERAKGLLMEKRGISEAEAFRRMRELAMDQKRTLADVADQLLAMADLL